MGRGIEHHAERPIISIAQVAALADTVDPRYRAMVLLATWAGLRFGETAGLRRVDVDLTEATVRVDRQLVELQGGQLIEGPPKTEAGRRLIALPPHVVPMQEWHLASFVGTDPLSHVFTSPDGAPLRRSNFNRRVWQLACAELGISGLRFHDLRHTGNTIAASTGASTKELMAKMGHASPRAALIYQHATLERDRTLADALSRLADGASTERPSLRLVRGGVDERYCGRALLWTSVTIPLPRALKGRTTTSPRRVRVLITPGGDDGTRTHDALLANKPTQDMCEHVRTRAS
jgi:hypothetical protein